MRPDHPALIEKRKPAGDLKDSLNDKHDVWAARVILIETKRDIVLQRPRQDTVLKLRDLLPVSQHDGVFTDEIDARDMAIKVNSHARPIQAGRDLFDMGRFSGSMIARDHDPAVAGKARENGKSRIAVKNIVWIEIGNVRLGR